MNDNCFSQMLIQNTRGTNILPQQDHNDIHKFWLIKKDNGECEFAPVHTMKAYKGVEI